MATLDYSLFEKVGALMLVLEPSGRIVYWNRACEELSGHTLREARGRRIWEFSLPPEHAAEVEATISEVRRTGRTTLSENDWFTKTGERRWMAWANAAITNERGHVTHIIRTGIDGTERKQAEERLRDSHAKFSGIISISADAIITVDEDQRITLFNEGAEQIFGWRSQEVTGASLDVLIPERFRSIHREHVRNFAKSPERARRMGHRIEISGLRKNGQEFPADAAISKLDVGGRYIFTVVLRDITDRKRMETEQRFLADASAILASSLDIEETLSAIGALTVQLLADYCIIDIADEGRIRRLRVVSREPGKHRSATACTMSRLTKCICLLQRRSLKLANPFS